VPRNKPGFTLLELIAALSLMGFAMIGGIMLIDQLGDAGSRIVAEGKRGARLGNGARLFGRELLDATTTTDSAQRFRGDERSLEVWTSCETPGGWLAPCHAVFAIDQHADSSIVLAQLSTGESFAVRRQIGALEFRYFDPTATRDTIWFRVWSSNINLPAGVALISAANDTTVFPVAAGR
jgi:prepilin-type N-terminal cleavage/methylation domain-containing protein